MSILKFLALLTVFVFLTMVFLLFLYMSLILFYLTFITVCNIFNLEYDKVKAYKMKKRLRKFFNSIKIS